MLVADNLDIINQPILQVGNNRLDAPTLLSKLSHYQLLQRLAQQLIIEDAIAEIDSDPEQIYRSFCQRQGLSTPEDQQAWLDQNQLSREELRERLVFSDRLNRFKEATWGNQIQTYFLRRKTSLDRVLYSLIRVEDSSLAQELYFRLNDDGASFSTLAKDYGEGSEAVSGGLIGPVELVKIHPGLAQLLSISEPGQLWVPTPIDNWVVILRLEKLLPAQLEGETRQRLLDELFQSWLDRQIQITPVKVLELH